MAAILNNTKYRTFPSWQKALLHSFGLEETLTFITHTPKHIHHTAHTPTLTTRRTHPHTEIEGLTSGVPKKAILP